MNIPLPSQKYLIERLIYHPSSGEFFWKEISEFSGKDAAWNDKYAGKMAGVVCFAIGYAIGRF